MAYTSEIEKLEKRWAENPKGRNFAPLADAYRKAGELDRAIELCKAGLGRHPDYVSAHIVYGRCLIDQKNDTGASEVFRKVLSLDPENVLGLRMLAEIAERGGRHDEAVEWLARLLAADPMNGDAAEALSRAKGKASQASQASPASQAATVKTVAQPAAAAAAAARPAAAPAPAAGRAGPAPAPPPARSAPPPAPGAPRAPAERAAAAKAPMARLVPEPPRAAPAQPPLPPPAARMVGGLVVQSEEPPPPPHLQVSDQPRELETFDGTLSFNAVAHDAARADGLEVQEEVRLSPQDMQVEGLAHTQYESAMYMPPPETADDAFPKIDLPLIMPDDVSPRTPAAPAASPASAAPAAPASAHAAATPPAPAAPAAPVPGRGSASAPPAAVQLSDDDGAADTATLSRAEPVLTETMAELYLRQGHLDEALRVYQALLAQRPSDARLRARVEALTPGGRQGRDGSGESLPDFLRRILTARLDAAPEPPPPPAPPPAWAPPLAARAPQRAAPAREADSTMARGGSLLEEATAHVAPVRERGSQVDSPGEATRPAGDSISLDQVFGDEGPRSAAPSAAPSAEPAPSAAPAPAPEQTQGFSFDQFFSAMAPGGSGVPGAPAGDAAARGGEAGGSGAAGRAGGASPESGSAPGSGRPSGPKPRPQAEDEGDLDQFQAWLRGLKS